MLGSLSSSHHRRQPARKMGERFFGRAGRSVGVVARRSRGLAKLPARWVCAWDNFRRFAAGFAELEDSLLNKRGSCQFCAMDQSWAFSGSPR
jgi:hypothetical protein